MGVKRVIGEKSRDKRKKQKVNPTVLIISEGKDTEVNYFKKFNQRYVNVDVKIADKSSVGKNKSRKTDPAHLIDKAINYIELKYDINEEDGDRVWCLMDVDINYENPDSVNQRIDEIGMAYKKVKDYEKITKHSITLGISNPCFELWYLIHYIYTTGNLKDYSAVKDRIEKNTPLKDYEKNKSVYDVIHDNTQEAIQNADDLKNHHESLGRTLINISKNSYVLHIKNIIESNPYTNVSDLVKYIKELNENQ